MADYLGADQQSPSPPFLRTFYKTDFQRVRERMISILKQRAKWDLVNPSLWGQVGLTGAPIDDFLENYIAVASEVQKPLNRDTAALFKAMIYEQYGTPADRLDVYIETFITMADNNEIPKTILYPWTYTPESSIGEDISKIVRRGGATIAVVGIIAVGVYAFASRGVPALIRE